MKPVDITSFATLEDKSKFNSFVQKCDYYIVALPKTKEGMQWFSMFSGDIKTNIRVVRAEEISFFMKSHKMIIQNGSTVIMNWDGE